MSGQRWCASGEVRKLIEARERESWAEAESAGKQLSGRRGWGLGSTSEMVYDAQIVKEQ